MKKKIVLKGKSAQKRSLQLVKSPIHVQIVEALHEVLRWHARFKNLPDPIATRLLSILPPDKDDIADLQELTKREVEAHKTFSIDLGDVAKGWKKEIQDLRRDGLERLAQDRGLWSPDDGHASLAWFRVRLLYWHQEQRRHSFGLETPAMVRERIKFLDETKTVPPTTIDPVTGEWVGEYMTQVSKTGPPDRKRRARASGAEDGEPRMTIKAFLSDLFKKNLEEKNDDKELAAKLTEAFPKKKWTEKDIRRKRARYNRKEAGVVKTPEFRKGKPVGKGEKVVEDKKPPVVVKKKVVVIKKVKK